MDPKGEYIHFLIKTQSSIHSFIHTLTTHSNQGFCQGLEGDSTKNQRPTPCLRIETNKVGVIGRRAFRWLNTNRTTFFRTKTQ